MAYLWAYHKRLDYHDDSSDCSDSSYYSDSNSDHDYYEKVPMVPHLSQDKLQVYLWLGQVIELILRYRAQVRITDPMLSDLLPNVNILTTDEAQEFFNPTSLYFDPIDESLIADWSQSSRCWHDHFEVSYRSDFASNYHLFRRLCWDVSHNYDSTETVEAKLIDLTQWTVWQ